MARKLVEKGTNRSSEERPTVITHDPVSEAIVIAACAQDRAVLRTHMRILRPDHFLVREHIEVWTALVDLERKGLEYDVEAIERIGGVKAAQTVVQLIEARPGVAPNIAWHVSNIRWDKIRAEAVKGPIASLVEAVRDPTADPSRIRSLAKQVSTSFENADREHLLDGKELVRQNMRDLDERLVGRETYPFGIDTLDFYESGKRRLVAGTRPGMTTVITSSSGAGKTTVTANLTLALVGLKKRVLYGAWEMLGRLTLEILAGMQLGWLRADLMDPKNAEPDAPIRTREGRILLEETQHELNKYVTFAANPFRKRIGEKPSNERNLDIVHQMIVDSGCDVFVADLWKRCLAAGKSKPDDEEDALLRQQAMGEECHVHQFLLQQQRLKDLEQRADKRPTREAIKGTSAWTDIADTIFGIHRPALWKNIADDRIELDILKQRYAPWPLAIEFDWNPATGLIAGGRSIEYTRPGEVSELDQSVGGMGKWLGGKGKKRGKDRS